LSAQDRKAGVVWDRRMRLGVHGTGPLLRVVRVEAQGKIFQLATSRQDLEAELIGLIYRQRWQIEVFFKWIKTLLNGGHWFAESQTGAEIQIYCVLICALLLMLFNRDRMRAGDLIGGTLVIVLPRQRLLGDLVETRARFAFADHQLAAYGKRELQVLEDLLRRRDDAETRALLRDVCDRICRKIEWSEPLAPNDTAPFLRDFYTAQRAYLEREQLFGRRLADKFEAAERRE